MAEIVNFPGITKLDISPERILANAAEQKFSGVIVIGYLEDGSEYVSSSYADGGFVVWHCIRTIHKLMRIADEAEDLLNG